VSLIMLVLSLLCLWRALVLRSRDPDPPPKRKRGKKKRPLSPLQRLLQRLFVHKKRPPPQSA
jgi:hypothetical protein